MFTLNCKGRLWVVDKPQVMGIINCTPDSFYGGSRLIDARKIGEKAAEMYGQGASVVDLGGQSTRPGAETVSAAEEWERLLPAIEAVKTQCPDLFISIDTYYASVAEKALQAGADLINDISGGTYEPEILSIAAQYRVPYVCMHIKGTPATMQQLATYENVTRELLDHFIERLDTCQKAGIKDVIIDPGFGFAKTIEHNFTLLKELSSFSILHKPILVGLSRKTTIWKTLGTSPDQALNGTTVLNSIALMNGASFLRVHDVREAWEAVQLVQHCIK